MRIAVIGTGIAGNAAAWAPSKRYPITVYDRDISYGFASRLLQGGDIGIAEAYLHGEWDTPDLTQFLYLFCVNQDWMQSMLIGSPLMRTLQAIRHWFKTPGDRHAATSTRIKTSETPSIRRGSIRA
jgi:hypothetical protein